MTVVDPCVLKLPLLDRMYEEYPSGERIRLEPRHLAIGQLAGNIPQPRGPDQVSHLLSTAGQLASALAMLPGTSCCQRICTLLE